ncbi:MAG: hypothetical protein ACREQJ_17685 [Candidatus Binatia bacterium]
MRRSARAQPGELIAQAAGIGRQRQRLERLLIAGGPILAAVAATALGLAPAWLGALVALTATVWAVAGLRSDRESELAAARRIDARLEAKETFLTWTTVPDTARGPLWPVVDERASETATGESPRRFATAFAWRAPLASVAVSLAVVGLLFLLVELRPVAPTATLLEIADRLDAPGRDAASRALGAELREVARRLADPNVSAEEKRELVAEMKQKLEQQQAAEKQRQQGGQGQGQSRDQKGNAEQSGATSPKGQGKGQSQGEQQGGGEAGAAASALGQIERELAGESPGEKESPGEPQQEKGEKGQGGGVQGPSEGQRPGEKPGESDGNQPGPKNEAGKSEQGQGEGGRQSGEKPEGQPENPGQNPQGEGRGEGAGASGKPSPADDGQKAERYYKLGEGPDALRVEDGQFVKVLVPEQGGGAGTERVQKPGEAIVETPFGNAPLPSEGPPGSADERQPVPLEYRPILRK